MSEAVKHWQEITARIGARARLVAVSKTFAAAEIEPLILAGQRAFGENRVQEAQGKWPGLKSKYPDLEVLLIGPLQSNKVAEALALFDVIQTIDRPKIVEAIAAACAKQGKALRYFIQVNTGREPQKAGVMPEAVDDFLHLCRQAYRLNVVGLMCIPPAEGDPRPHFKALAEMAARNGLKELSMGMSGDFETAIAEGASYVRVGSAIFGTRSNP